MAQKSIELDSESDVEFEDELSQQVNEYVIPPKSKGRYDLIYKRFQKWKASQNTASNSEAILMAFLEDYGKNKQPPSLYAAYSMLKATIKINDNVDIGTYHKLTTYLKEKSVGYKPNKAKVFTEEEIERFINEAPDEAWLDVKVVCIFGLCGACRTHELPHVNVEHVKKYGKKLFLVTLPVTKNKAPQSFPITGTYFDIVEKYADMRPSHAVCDNFFLTFRNGKCTVQTVGKGKIAKMPQRIAKYLNLPEPERYTGHSLRKTSHSISGTPTMPRRHRPQSSKKLANDSIERKKRTKDSISTAANCTRTSASDTSPTVDSNDSFENLNSFGDNILVKQCSSSAPAASEPLVVDKSVLDDSDDCFVNTIDPLGDITSDLDY